MKPLSSHCTIGRAALLLTAAALPAPVLGALTWNSAGTTDSWSTAAGNANWLPGNVLWTQNESAIFDGSSGTPETVTVDTANIFNDITFDVDGFSVANGAGSLTLANDQASTITVTNAAHTGSVLESLANSSNGISSLTKAGAGTLVLGGAAASTYTGQTLVNAGTLKAASVTALGAGGAGAETLVASGATLDVNGQALTNTEIIRITGTGVGGNGALVNTGAAQTNALNRVDLTGNASVGGSARFDIRAGTTPTLDLAGNTLTKVGTNQFSVVGGTISNGNITVNGGIFGVETSTLLQGTGTVTVNAAGSLGFWANPVGNVTRPITSNNGTLINLGSGGTVNSAIGIVGGTTIATGGVTTTFVGNITGSGPLNYTGNGAASPNGTNSYTGGTTITDARVNVGANVNAVPDGTITVNGDGTVPDGQLYVAGATLPATKNYAISGLGGNNVDSTQRGALRLDNGTVIEGNIVLIGNAGFGTGGGASDVGTVNGDISGAFGVTKLNPSLIEFAGINSYSGPTTIRGGTLRLNYDIENSSKLSNTAPLVFDGTGTLMLFGGTHAEIVQSTTLNAGAAATLDSSDPNSWIELGAITRAARATLNVTYPDVAKTTSGTLGEAFGSWLTVGGQLGTRGASNYLVPVTLEDHSTVSGPAIADGAGHVNLIDAAGTVALGGNPGDVIDVKTISRTTSGVAIIDTTGKTLRLGQPGTILSGTDSGGITFGTANNAGNLTAGGPTNNTPGTIDLRQIAGTVTLRSTITDNGTGTVTLATRGTVWVTGTNTYTGGTVIEGFYHGINADAALGAVPASFDPDNIILDGGTLSCYSGAYASVAVDANRGLTLTSNGGTFDAGGGQTLAINGVITGPGNINTNTSGIVALNALNTYTGTTTLGVGTTLSVNTLKDVADATGSSLGNPATAAVGTIAIGSNSRLLYTGTGSTTNRVLNLSGTTASHTATLDQSGTGVLRFTSALTATGGSVKTLVLQGSSAGSGVLAGVIPNNSATNTTALTKNGTGSWTLVAASTFTGNTTVNGGTLQLGEAAATDYGGTGRVRGTIAVNAGATLVSQGINTFGYATGSKVNQLDLVDATYTHNGTGDNGWGITYNLTGSTIQTTDANGRFSFGGAAGSPTVVNSLASNNPSTIGGRVNLRSDNTNTVTFTVADGAAANDLAVTALVYGNSVPIFKAGPGRMVMSGANTYNGATTVNAGSLLINGVTTGTGAVTVNSGGTLGGTGTIAGAVTVNASATIAPGASAGTLSTGAAIIDGTYACEIDGANADRLAVTGNLDIDGASLNVSVLGGGANQPEYIIATYTGTLTGVFTGLPQGATVITGYTISYATAGQIKLVGSASPYSTWASSFSPNPGAANVDFENDGFQNGVEFILGGSPISGSDNPKIQSFIADSSDVGTDRELIMTIAVPVGTPPFAAGAPATSSYGGFGIAVSGSTTLASFPVNVTPVTPITTGLPALTPQGGVSYEYRSFSLDGSNGTPTKGFLRVEVTNP